MSFAFLHFLTNSNDDEDNFLSYSKGHKYITCLLSIICLVCCFTGGAMRIPKNHYCTNGYIKKFDIDLRNFQNYNGDTWLYLDGIGKIRTKGKTV